MKFYVLKMSDTEWVSGVDFRRKKSSINYERTSADAYNFQARDQAEALLCLVKILLPDRLHVIEEVEV